MDDDDEVVEFGRPRMPRRLRVGGLLLVGIAVLAFAVGRLWPSPDSTEHLSVPSDSALLPPTTQTRPWPTASGACASEVGLSIVSSTLPTERTGIQVLLGGNRLWTVDFDTGRAMTPSALRADEYAVVLAAGPRGTYVTASSCEATRSRLVRLDNKLDIRPLGPLSQTEAVLTSDKGAWVASYPPDAEHTYGTVRPIGGGSVVRLPAGFFPYGAVGTVLVGLQQPDPSAAPVNLLMVDTATGRIRAELGRSTGLVAAGNGLVVWSSGCDPYGGGSCVLHRRSIISGATTSYPLPRAAGGGIISPDGKMLAFRLERATMDSRYDLGHPAPPSDVAILRLDSGRLDIVPGIEIPPKTAPGLTFSTDGRWLVIALDAGDRIRLLAWRPGLNLPFETGSIAGQVLGSPALTAEPLPHR